MSVRRIKLTILAVLAIVATVPAAADEGPRMSRPHYDRYRLLLPPERHVIEVVQPPWSGNFIINGRRFTAVSPACFSWAAGEQIKLIEGDWKFIAPNPGAQPFNKNTSIETGNSPEPQLYNLRSDIGEKNNLAAREPERVKTMAALLDNIRAAPRSRP